MYSSTIGVVEFEKFSETILAQDLAQAANDILTRIWCELESDVSKPKSAIIASSETLKKLVTPMQRVRPEGKWEEEQASQDG